MERTGDNIQANECGVGVGSRVVYILCINGRVGQVGNDRITSTKRVYRQINLISIQHQRGFGTGIMLKPLGDAGRRQVLDGRGEHLVAHLDTALEGMVTGTGLRRHYLMNGVVVVKGRVRMVV